MESFSIWYWLVIILISAATLYPYVRIIRRTGHSGWWLLAGIVPVLNFVMLWVFAFARWPALEGQRRP